jgi:hypothetical protein
MAVTSNVLIGKSHGSVGNATFSTWKGINVLKEKAVSVANPNTDAQQMQRSAMRQIVAIFRLIPGIVDAGFKKLAIKKSPFNAFTSYALKNTFDFSAPPVATFVPADLLISKGTITPAAITASSRSLSDAMFRCEWDSNVLAPGQSLADFAIGVAFNVTKNTWGTSVLSNTRDIQIQDITIPAGSVIGDTVRLYLGFYNSTSGESSDSLNTTGLVVA